MSASKPANPEPTEIDGRYFVEQEAGRRRVRHRLHGAGPGARAHAWRSRRSASRASPRRVCLARGSPRALQAGGQVAANLKHPNIVGHLRARQAAGGIQLPRMEFVDGVGLDRVIAGSGRCRSSARRRSAPRWRTPWATRTRTASSTATSSPRTS